ncbi:MAG: MmcQ/YjbR family DNA-binding protein [Oscillospiraceae bacterium]|nr:MmcQ/YjbR family DNA-binding protein [Oscillospiraceae bacterium]
MTIREQLDAYVKEKYGIDPEVLPFSKENYGVYRHPETGKWFAVFIVKDRSAFGLSGSGEVEVVSFKIRGRVHSDFVIQQPGYLPGLPARNWNWTTAVLDGTIPYEDICRWVDESFEATKTKTKNKRTPLPKAEP